MRAVRWLLPVCLAWPAGPVRADYTASRVCDVILPCRNFSGSVKEIGDKGNGEFELRLMMSKLSVGTVLVSHLLIYADGGHEYEAMTWDFWTDKDDVEPGGKFIVYSDLPDVGGSNKIGAGRCVNGNCTFEYVRDGTTMSGKLRVKSGPRLDITEKQVSIENKQQASVERKGELVLDER